MTDEESPEGARHKRTPPAPPAMKVEQSPPSDSNADEPRTDSPPQVPGPVDWIDHPGRQRRPSQGGRKGRLRRLRRKWRRWRRHRRTLAKVAPWYRPRNLALAVVALVFIAALSLVITAYVRVSDIRRAPLLPLETSPASLGTNIVLLGSDGQPGSLILDPTTLVVQFIHISAGFGSGEVVDLPRDLVIGPKAATVESLYRAGGVSGLISVLQKDMHLTVNHVLQTSFDGYARVTDDVGALSIKTDSGPRQFTGAQAQAYAAAPNPTGGTIETGHRYQQWSKSLLQATLQPQVLLNPFTVWSVFLDTTGDLVVDDTLTNSELFRLTWHLASLRPSDLHFVTAPNAGYGVVDGKHVLRASPAAFAELSTAIRTDNLATLGLFQ